MSIFNTLRQRRISSSAVQVVGFARKNQLPAGAPPLVPSAPQNCLGHRVGRHFSSGLLQFAADFQKAVEAVLAQFFR